MEKNTRVGGELPFSPAFKLMGSCLSGFGRNAKLSTLIYHRVLSEPDPYRTGDVTVKEFQWQMSLLARHFNVLPLDDALHRLQNGNLPPRSICITFDDGYADNSENALPILKKCNLGATFFIATRFLDGGIMWNDVVIESIKNYQGNQIDLVPIGMTTTPVVSIEQRKQLIGDIIDKFKRNHSDERQEKVNRLLEVANVNLPKSLMMTNEQVNSLYQSGMLIGSHTISHPILASIDNNRGRIEIENGKKELEKITNSEIRLFAYPNGKPGTDYKREHVNIVKEIGFDGAVSTAWGTTRHCDDLYQIRRFTPWDKEPVRFIFRLFKNYFGNQAVI